MNSLPLSTIREQRGKDVFLRVTCGVGVRDIDSIEEKFCTADELSWKGDYEQDQFAEKLARKLQRRHFWKNLLKRIFSPTKTKG